MRADEPQRRFSLPGKIGALVAALVGIAGGTAAVAAALGANPWLIGFAAVSVALPVGLAALHRMFDRPLRVLQALEDGVQGFRAGDFSLRLRVEGDDELGSLVGLYNDIGDTLREERTHVRQRELLLTTALETSPAALVLTNSLDRVLFANRAARDLLHQGQRLEGHDFAEILADTPQSLREAIASGQDTLLTLPPNGQPRSDQQPGRQHGGQEETFQVSRRRFELNARRHHLLMLRHLTPDLRRQEMAAYKRVIRIINHELNNTLAPVSSLVHSARLLVRQPDEGARLEEVFTTIDACVRRLHAYIDGYASFARLPRPRKQQVEAGQFLQQLGELRQFTIQGPVPTMWVSIDPGQMQSVLLNLLKNATEAGSPSDAIEVGVERTVDGGVALTVLDRGQGMDPETMRQSLVPFFSSKPGGTGLGLALSREIVDAHGGRLTVAGRAGGGIVVTCWLPG